MADRQTQASKRRAVAACNGEAPPLTTVLVAAALGLTALCFVVGSRVASLKSSSSAFIRTHEREHIAYVLPQPWVDSDAGANIPPDAPELHNGIGPHIRVFTYADDDNHPDVLRIRRTCSSRLQVLKNTQYGGGGWNWHHKLHRLFPGIRDMHDNQLVLIMDGDSACFPCTRNLTAEFLRFQTGILFAGYPFFIEPQRQKTNWFPPAQLVRNHNDADRKRHDAFRYLNAGHIMAFAGALKRVLSDFYLRSSTIDVKEFDDQASFWTNMYLAQFYAPQTSAFAHSQHFKPGLRISLDAEGLIFQLFMRHYKGKWRRTPAGHLVRDEVYDGLECCLMHFVGNKEAIGTFFSYWDAAGRELLRSRNVSKAENETEEHAVWNATDSHGNVPVWGKCETPKPWEDPAWDWLAPHEGQMKCGDVM